MSIFQTRPRGQQLTVLHDDVALQPIETVRRFPYSPVTVAFAIDTLCALGDAEELFGADKQRSFTEWHGP